MIPLPHAGIYKTIHVAFGKGRYMMLLYIFHLLLVDDMIIKLLIKI